MPDKLSPKNSIRSEVSVIISTHNRSKRLKRCIKTIISNTVLPSEIVIVDDSDIGKDCKGLINALKRKYSNIIFTYRRVYLKRGVGFSRNLGINASRSQIVAFIDDDADASRNWIEKIIQSHSKYKKTVAITGFVIPSRPKNYWNKVIFQLYKKQTKKLKETNFLFGTNLSLKSKILKSHRIYFNNKMPYGSEDRDIAFRIQKAGFKMLFDPKIQVEHDYRTGIWEVVKQWLRYGMSDYYFWKLTPDYNSVDADYFRVGSPIKILLKAPYRIPKRVFTIVRNSDKKGANSLIPGMVLIFSTYYLGMYCGLVKDFLSSFSYH